VFSPLSTPHLQLGYIESTCSKDFNRNDLRIEGVEKILSINHDFHSVFYHSIPMSYLEITGQERILR